MTSEEQQLEEQTPGQWAVRWFAIVFVAGMCAFVPLVHVFWHGVLGKEEAVITTRSQITAPPMTTDSLLSGDWMAKKEIELRENSPFVWWLRGNWNEMRYRAGVPQSREVHIGKDDWFFIKDTVFPNVARYQRATEQRRRFLGEVRDIVEAAGAEFFMQIIPDKARVYADRAFEDGVVSPRKRENYGRILAELEELGIGTVDLATPLVAAAQAELASGSPRSLFFARDSHWLPGGALVTGRAIAAELERRYGHLLSPRVPAEITGPQEFFAVGDLTGQLGILTMMLPDEVTGTRLTGLSVLSQSFAEKRQYYGVRMLPESGPQAMNGDDPDAEILLIGTSFAQENGMSAMSLFLGRPIRRLIIRGSDGLKPLREAVKELRQGTKAKVVIWELAERGMFMKSWENPTL